MKLFLICLIAISLTGCATQFGQVQQSLTQWDDQNAQATVAISQQIMKHWRMNSVFWRIQIGPRIETEDYYRLKLAWDHLDALSNEITSAPVTEEQAGAVLSWYIKWVWAGGKELYNSVLPSILKLATQLGIKF